MALNVQIISQPSPGVRQMLINRLGAAAKGDLADWTFDCVALIQGRLVDMLAAADVAEKAAEVRAFDLKGLCPQHLTMIGLFGDVAAVKTSVQAVQEEGLG